MYGILTVQPHRYSRIGPWGYAMIACLCALIASTIGA